MRTVYRRRSNGIWRENGVTGHHGKVAVRAYPIAEAEVIVAESARADHAKVMSMSHEWSAGVIIAYDEELRDTGVRLDAGAVKGT
jgi:hypothetical protein